MAGFRVLAAFFSGLTMLITTVLVPVAYWGDKSPIWTKRLIVIDAAAAITFLVSVFYGI